MLKPTVALLAACLSVASVSQSTASPEGAQRQWGRAVLCSTIADHLAAQTAVLVEDFRRASPSLGPSAPATLAREQTRLQAQRGLALTLSRRAEDMLRRSYLGKAKEEDNAAVAQTLARERQSAERGLEGKSTSDLAEALDSNSCVDFLGKSS